MVSDENIIIINGAGKDLEENLFKFIGTLDKKQIGYVSISKEIVSLRDSLKKKGFNTRDFYFIDCISKTLTNPEEEEDSTFISSPNALTELSIAVTRLMKSSFIIVFDSLSSLSIYHKPEMIVRFVNSLIQKSKKNPESVLIFLTSKEQKETKWYKQIVGFSDKVID